MKRLMLAGLVSLVAFVSVQLSIPPVDASPPRCDLVRCEACPAGTELAPTGNNCCRCKPINGPDLSDCAAVLCPICPEGQVAAPTPGNCCLCKPA